MRKLQLRKLTALLRVPQSSWESQSEPRNQDSDSSAPHSPPQCGSWTEVEVGIQSSPRSGVQARGLQVSYGQLYLWGVERMSCDTCCM